MKSVGDGMLQRLDSTNQDAGLATSKEQQKRTLQEELT
jgi:hypothetical protein